MQGLFLYEKSRRFIDRFTFCVYNLLKEVGFIFFSRLDAFTSSLIYLRFSYNYQKDGTICTRYSRSIRYGSFRYSRHPRICRYGRCGSN